jgi:hypothetical protein
MKDLGYSCEGDTVTLRLTLTNFDALLICLGTAAAYPETRGIALRLANAINVGNTRWIPYEEEKS